MPCSQDAPRPLPSRMQFFEISLSLSTCHRVTIVAPKNFYLVNATQGNCATNQPVQQPIKQGSQSFNICNTNQHKHLKQCMQQCMPERICVPRAHANATFIITPVNHTKWSTQFSIPADYISQFLIRILFGGATWFQIGFFNWQQHHLNSGS